MARRTDRPSPLTWLMPLGTLAQFMLPRWVMVRAARVSGAIAFHVSRERRERLVANQRHLLGPTASEPDVVRAARRTMVNLVMNYLDLLRVPVLRKRTAGLVEFDPAVLDRTLALGRGLIIITPHLGNWDMAGIFLAALGYPMTAVAEPIPRGWSKTFNRYRNATAMQIVPIPDRRGLARALRSSRVVALVADRDLTGRGVVCPAFDCRRAFPKGPAAYSLKYNIPVVLGYMVFQDRPGHPPYYACVEPPLEFRPTGDTGADIDRFTELVAATLNRAIARYPDQWLVFNAAWQ